MVEHRRVGFGDEARAHIVALLREASDLAVQAGRLAGQHDERLKRACDNAANECDVAIIEVRDA